MQSFPDVSGAARALHDACEVLFPFSEFHGAEHDLYRTVIEGRAAIAHEAFMDSLGITY